MCEVLVGASAASFIIRTDGLISREWSCQARGRAGPSGSLQREGRGIAPPVLHFQALSAAPHTHSQLRFHKTIEQPPRLRRVGGGEFF